MKLACSQIICRYEKGKIPKQKAHKNATSELFNVLNASTNKAHSKGKGQKRTKKMDKIYTQFSTLSQNQRLFDSP